METNTLIAQFRALNENVTNEISILSNTSAFLNEVMEDVSWIGFYLYQNDELQLGPFQGKIACTSIKLNRGVCGYCATKRETVIVDDVHTFEGHIACDCATNSEIVIPIVIDDQLYGVLDIDSISFARFDNIDKHFLEAIVDELIKAIKSSR